MHTFYTGKYLTDTGSQILLLMCIPIAQIIFSLTAQYSTVLQLCSKVLYCNYTTGRGCSCPGSDWRSGAARRYRAFALHQAGWPTSVAVSQARLHTYFYTVQLIHSNSCYNIKTCDLMFQYIIKNKRGIRKKHERVATQPRMNIHPEMGKKCRSISCAIPVLTCLELINYLPLKSVPVCLVPVC